jgi:mersacidin/lichenicidin family type 2 lantibiotic
MSPRDVIRAWKDEEYRLGLNEEQRAALPAHPAGPIALADAALDEAGGGRVEGRTEATCTYRCWPK